MNDERLIDEFLATCDLRARAPDELVQRVHALTGTTLSGGRASAAPDLAEQRVWTVAPPRGRWAWLPRPTIAAVALGILAAGVAITLWLLRPQQPSVQPSITTTPQVVQDHPGAEPPEESPASAAEDTDGAPREREQAGDTRPDIELPPPNDYEGTEEEAVPDKVQPDEAAPRPRRQRPRDDAWRPGRIADVTGRADMRGGPTERPVDVREVASYGRVASVTGVVRIRREGREGLRSALVADALHAGDVIKTDPDSSLVAEFGDGSSLELAAETEVALGQPSGTARRPAKAELSRGDLVASIEPGGGAFQVETPLAVAAVRGTKFALESTDRKAVLTVLDGKVEFWNDLGSVLAAAMERSVVVPGHAPTEPHRLAGRQPGGIYAGKWHLHHGEYLHVDTIAHTTPEAQDLLGKLRTSPETPELLEAALGALWSRGGGITLSLECAREVVGRPGRLADLRRADLGTVHPLTVEEGTVGVPVFEVLDGSPAEAAGLNRGDAIVAIDGHPVATETDLICQLWRTDPESDVEVAFVRNGERRTATVASSAAKPGPQALALFAALRLLQTHPDHFSAQIVVANALACIGQLAEARAAYDALRSHHLTDPVVLNNLGVLAAVEGRLGDALAQYGKAAELSPKFEGAWLNIAKVYGRSGMDAAELGLLERLVDEHPEWETASVKLARTLAWHDRGGERLAEIEALIDHHPDSPELAAYLGRALEAGGQHGQAAAACERTLVMEPSFEVVDTPASRVLDAASDPDGAETVWGAWAVNQEPWSYVRVGSTEALEQGVRLDPLNSTGYTGYLWKFLGDCQFRAADYTVALESYLNAAELEPEWGMPWQCAAEAAEAAGEPDRAWDYRAEALKVGSEYGEAHKENLEVALRTAILLARRAADQGDRKAQDEFIRQGEDAAEKAESLANEAAGKLYAFLANEIYVPRQDWDTVTRVCRKALEVGPEGAIEPVVQAAGAAWAAGAPEQAAELYAMSLGIEPQQGAAHGLRMLELGRQLPAAQRAQLKAAHALARLDADRAVDRVATLVAQDPTSAAARLALWAATRDRDTQTAVEAALAAVSGARPDSDRRTYADVAQFLARTDVGAGLAAFAARLHATGGVVGPLGRGYAKLVVAARKCEEIAAVVEAILEGNDDDLAEEVAQLLSAEARHEEAMALMEHAVRLDYCGAWDRCYRALDVFTAAGERDRLLTLYEELGHASPGDGMLALNLGALWERAGNRSKWRYWLKRAEAAGAAPDEVAWGWGRWHQAGGNLLRARDCYRQTAGASWRVWMERRFARIDALGDALGPVDTLCGWVRGELSDQAAGEAGEAALLAADEGRPWMGVSEALGTVADRESGRAVEWAQALARQYPQNAAALWAAGEMAGEPGSAREMLEELAADGSLNADTQLALWSATKDEDREAATRAALAAVRLADANAPRNAYTAVADFLSGSDPLAGLDAFAARVEATGGVHGPLGSGYLRLAAVVGDVDRLSGAVDAILAGEDEVLADEVAVALSLGGRHEEAMALMEHAIRIDPAGPHWFAAPPLFAAAGQGSRLLALYERIAAERSGDSATALAAASVAMALGDRDRARYWIDRGLALDPQNLWILTRRGWWHEWNGDLEAARRDIERARPSGSPLIDESRERLDVLGEASPPLYAVCFVYAGYDLQRGWIPARTAESAAIEAGKAVGPWLAVAAALRTLAEYQPDRTVEWAERAAEEYPGNLAAQVGLAVIATGIETGGLDDSAAVARPALDAADGTDPDLTPCVHTVCGEILLREGSREEAADAFRRALDDPCMAPEWKARAEAGLQAASEPGDTE